VSTNYTLSLNRLFLSNRTEHLGSVICKIQLIKWWQISDISIKSYPSSKCEKIVKIYVPTCPVFAGPVTCIKHFLCKAGFTASQQAILLKRCRIRNIVVEGLLEFINTLHGGWGVLGTSCFC